MDYIQGNLGKGETVLLRAKVNWLAIVAPVIWGIFLEAVDIVLRMLVFGLLKDLLANIFGAEAQTGDTVFNVIKIIVTVLLHLWGWLPVIKRVFRLLTTKLAVTNKRVIGKTGIFSIETIDFHIDKVDNVSYNAGFWGNLFHFYDLTIAGTGGKNRTIKYISNAQALKNTVNDAIEKYAEEARKAQAADIAAAMGGANSNGGAV